MALTEIGYLMHTQRNSQVYLFIYIFFKEKVNKYCGIYCLQIPAEFLSKIQEACTNMSLESGKALKELGLAIKAMTPPSSATPHILKSKDVANNLKCLLQSGLCEEINLLEVIPAAAVASMLVDVVCCTEKIAESIYELASLAQFICVEPMVEVEKPKLLHQETIPPCCGMNEPHHVITIDQPSPKLP